MTAYLILENGAVFKGQQFGYDGEAVGELVFTTEAAGYLETLGDPSYYGQIVLQTFPLIGNYGVIPADIRGGIRLKAYIVRQWCQEPSNFRSEGTLDIFLRENKIPGLCGIDTRRLTHIIRENGVMNAKISKTPELSDAEWAQLRAYKVENAVEGCMMNVGFNLFHYGDKPKYNVVLWDFGDCSRQLKELVVHGCEAKLVRYTARADEILTLCPDGIILSEGPGDPAENTAIIEEIRKLCDTKIPILGVGLGHQMLALALGASTKKLPFGHRGANQPVREIETGRVFVTSQNHGYAVDPATLPAGAVMNYVNCNDGTCEGIAYTNERALSVQFRPDEDSKRVYDMFAKMLGKGDAICR